MVKNAVDSIRINSIKINSVQKLQFYPWYKSLKGLVVIFITVAVAIALVICYLICYLPTTEDFNLTNLLGGIDALDGIDKVNEIDEMDENDTEMNENDTEVTVGLDIETVEIYSTQSWLGKYKYKLLGLGFGLCLIGLWYWFNKPGNSPTINEEEYITTSNTLPKPTPDFGNISSITYEDRYRVRRSIRESLFEDIRLSTQLQERNEQLALETVNLNSLSREEMIQRIRDSDVSPNTAVDAIQSLLREAARGAGEVVENTVSSSTSTSIPMPTSNALIPYNSITDLVIYDPSNVPIPNSVDIASYELFIQYLDHYNAIIAAYGF